MPQNKTVFVTGASGLLGINVIEDLLLHKYNVIGLLLNKNKFPLPKNKQLKIIIGDIKVSKLLPMTGQSPIALQTSMSPLIMKELVMPSRKASLSICVLRVSHPKVSAFFK